MSISALNRRGSCTAAVITLSLIILGGCGGEPESTLASPTRLFADPDVIETLSTVHKALSEESREALINASRRSMEISEAEPVNLNAPVKLRFELDRQNYRTHSSMAFDSAVELQVQAVNLAHQSQLIVHLGSLERGGMLELTVEVSRGEESLWRSRLTPTIWMNNQWQEISFELPRFDGDVSISLSAVPSTNSTYVIGDPAILPRRPEVAPEELPNIILVSLDTLRADHLGYMGYHRDTSPHMDALAAQSINFTKAYAQAGFTLPSHKSIFSGYYPQVFDYYSNSSDENQKKLTGEIPMLAEYLREAGYYNIAFTGGVFLNSTYGFSRGFDSYTESKVSLDFTDNKFRRTKESGFDNALQWLHHNEHSGPYFMFLHTYGIHAPYAPPREYDALFGENESDVFGDSIDINILRAYNDGKLDTDDLDQEDIDQVIRVYDRGIRWIDAQLGKLIEMLRQRGELENTMIVVLSDHGEEFLEHGRFEHRTMWDVQLYVPLMIHYPRLISEPVEVDTHVELVDVTPTILDLLGLETALPMQGASLLRFMAGDELPAYERPIWASQDFYVTCKYNDYKYHVVFRKNRDAISERLYDLASDPGEQVNLVQEGMSPEQELILKQLRSRVHYYIAESTPGYNIMVNSDLPALEIEMEDISLDEKLASLGRAWSVVQKRHSLVVNVPGEIELRRGVLMFSDEVVGPDGSFSFTGRHKIAVGLGGEQAADAIVPLSLISDQFANPSVSEGLPEALLEVFDVIIWKTLHPFEDRELFESVLSEDTKNDLRNMGYLQ